MAPALTCDDFCPPNLVVVNPDNQRRSDSVQMDKPNKSVPLLGTFKSSREDVTDYETLSLRVNPPSVVFDNSSDPTSTLIKVDSANRHGCLLQVVQLLTDLDFVIRKAHISSDGGWFVDVFHVTDQSGKKLSDHSVMNYIRQSLGAKSDDDCLSVRATPAARQSLGRVLGGIEGQTAIELTGKDRPGLLADISSVLFSYGCNVTAAEVWTHNSRVACVVYATDKVSGKAIMDAELLEEVKRELAAVMRKGGEGWAGEGKGISGVGERETGREMGKKEGSLLPRLVESDEENSSSEGERVIQKTKGVHAKELEREVGGDGPREGGGKGVVSVPEFCSVKLKNPPSAISPTVRSLGSRPSKLSADLTTDNPITLFPDGDALSVHPERRLHQMMFDDRDFEEGGDERREEKEGRERGWGFGIRRRDLFPLGSGSSNIGSPFTAFGGKSVDDRSSAGSGGGAGAWNRNVSEPSLYTSQVPSPGSYNASYLRDATDVAGSTERAGVERRVMSSSSIASPSDSATPPAAIFLSPSVQSVQSVASAFPTARDRSASPFPLSLQSVQSIIPVARQDGLYLSQAHSSADRSVLSYGGQILNQNLGQNLGQLFPGQHLGRFSYQGTGRDEVHGKSVRHSDSSGIAISVSNCDDSKYSVVHIECVDRRKLLFDCVCTLTDMGYVVFHATIDSDQETGRAMQEYFIRHMDGCTLDSFAERERVMKCLEAAIERRMPEGLRVELCATDRVGLLADVTRIFLRLGLTITCAFVSTRANKAVNEFYVKRATSVEGGAEEEQGGEGEDVSDATVEALRREIGPSLVKMVKGRSSPSCKLRNGGKKKLALSAGQTTQRNANDQRADVRGAGGGGFEANGEMRSGSCSRRVGGVGEEGSRISMHGGASSASVWDTNASGRAGEPAHRGLLELFSTRGGEGGSEGEKGRGGGAVVEKAKGISLTFSWANILKSQSERVLSSLGLSTAAPPSSSSSSNLSNKNAISEFGPSNLGNSAQKWTAQSDPPVIGSNIVGGNGFGLQQQSQHQHFPFFQTAQGSNLGLGGYFLPQQQMTGTITNTAAIGSAVPFSGEVFGGVDGGRVSAAAGVVGVFNGTNYNLSQQHQQQQQYMVYQQHMHNQSSPAAAAATRDAAGAGVMKEGRRGREGVGAGIVTLNSPSISFHHPMQSQP